MNATRSLHQSCLRQSIRRLPRRTYEGTDLFLEKLLSRRCRQRLMAPHRAIRLREKADELMLSHQCLEGRNPDVTGASEKKTHERKAKD